MSEAVEPDEPAGFDLPANADIRVAEEIVEACRTALEATGDVRIGCDGVERLDASVVQCLVALHDGLAQSGRALVLADPSAAFVRTIDVTGLTDRLVGTPRPAA